MSFFIFETVFKYFLFLCQAKYIFRCLKKLLKFFKILSVSLAGEIRPCIGIEGGGAPAFQTKELSNVKKDRNKRNQILQKLNFIDIFRSCNTQNGFGCFGRFHTVLSRIIPLGHSWKKCFCLRKPVFWGGIFRILMMNFPNLEEDFPNIEEKFS